ncbi:DUF4176 domain-containing protein [Cerasibacillus terrae]|uniref:DUF4176 domain-containing protein n=1 Tax=Cerasibacillus terrae TaxID=2498845 RepID=A0A5C8NWS9_9BACI|nr:DUF4176 domain-containing protein [Cerasibacillus terrae]TXL65728.1 DUF4176 domain-containing protein [Cerasibacillus terrae]
MNEEFKNQLRKLALQKVDQITQSLKEETRLKYGHAIRDFFNQFIEDETVFQQLYHAYKKRTSFDLHRKHITLSYTYEDTSHTIAFLDKRFSLDETTFVQLLSNTIEITREVLPLGSIVELDPAYFKPDKENTSPSKVVITGRFIAPQGYHSYFPYVGVVYPVGEVKIGSQIYFTTPLIKKVIHQGYTDEMEDAFVFLMKQEFIVEKNMNSIEFSNQDMKKLQQEMKEKKKVGES